MQINNAKRKQETTINHEDFFFPLEKHVHQTPTAKNSGTVCAESAIRQSQILKEFIFAPSKTLAGAQMTKRRKNNRSHGNNTYLVCYGKYRGD